MNEFIEIEEWTIPTWHHDFGDPCEELSALAEFCKKLREFNQYFFKLDCYEEGYMKVDLYKSKRKFGEIYTNNEGTGKYSLFFDAFEDEDEEEYYFTSVKEGVDYITQHFIHGVL